jgi:hypothetical protein
MVRVYLYLWGRVVIKSAPCHSSIAKERIKNWQGVFGHKIKTDMVPA